MTGALAPRDRCYSDTSATSRVLDAPLPPNHRSDHGRDQRHENQDNPAQPAQRILLKTEGERLRDFRRDTDKLFPAQQPVHTARDEVEPC